MKIYTRTGDEGTTGLFGGERRRKNDQRVVAYGTVDEANSAIGLVRAIAGEPDVDKVLARVQNTLFDLGADLATPEGARQRERLEPVREEDVTWLEETIDSYSAELEPLRQFILPGGTEPAAAAHLARTIARRAEREVVTLAETEAVDATIGAYLNRLSDLLFVLARVLNQRDGVSETRWHVRGRNQQGRAPGS